jgi:8-oxo-dGTP pyrophosphatase MutT (NUDIX family)
MEIWDLYDEQGWKTGETWERSRAKEIPEGRYHIVCDILIRHQDGTFLITLRDPNKDIYPGCLEASAGGSALSGETPEQAAKREMFEETGLSAEKLELIGITRKPQSRSVIYAYLAAVACDKDSVRLQPGETVGYQWVDPQVFLRMIREEPVLKIQYPRYKPYLDTLERKA